MPGVAIAKTKVKNTDKKEVETSGHYVNDFVWAFRLTEVSKGLFSSDPSAKVVTKGTVFAPGSDNVDVNLVLAEEGLGGDDVHALEVFKGDEQQFLVTMEGY